MSIRAIDEEDFETFVSRSPLAPVREYAWYRSDTLSLVGVLIQDLIDKDWGYLVFSPGGEGNYEPIEIKSSIETQHEANRLLYSKMVDIEATGVLNEDFYTDNKVNLDLPKIEVMTIDDHIKAYFKKHPEKLYELSPRKFEELVASIIKDMGFDVELTQATRDGGRDIIAYIRNGITSFLTHIECKRYAPENKVNVDIIRSVTGVHHIRNANKSVIVTTGFFTKDAREEAKLVEHMLDLKDYNDLKGLLARY